MPKVSVIVPVYNVEKYLEKCLNSLVNQTINDIEIIVVNDESPDNSQRIIDDFETRYPDKVKKIVKKNGGQGSARNEGLKVATGEYIGYVDSDDYVSNDMFEKMYNAAKKDDSDIVIAGFYVVSESGNVLNQEVFKCEKNVTTIEETKEVLFDKTAIWNKIYRASLLKNSNVEFVSKKWYEDFDFTINTLILAKRFSIIEEPLYYYLLRQNSTMNNSNVEKNLDILDAMDRIICFYKKNNIYHKYLEEMEFMAIKYIYIPTICRIIRANADRKIKRDTIRAILEYLNRNFPEFKKNKYIKKMPYSRKVIMKLLNIKLYGIIWLSFKLKSIKR